MSQNESGATDATLTEHLSASDNKDPSIEGPARITHIKVGTSWQTDDAEQLDTDPDEYIVECSCGEKFGNWGAAANHAEQEH